MNTPKTESGIRRWLAGKLKRRRVSGWLWSRLRDRGYVKDVLDNQDGEALSDLLDEARSLLRLIRRAEGQKPLPGRRNPVQPEAFLSAQEAKRADTFSKYLALLASANEEVRRFREQVLAGETLPQKKAASLLGSPAPYFLSPTEFESRSIPILGHRAHAELTREDIDRVSWLQQIALKVEWPGGSRSYQFQIRRTASDQNWLAVPPQAWPVQSLPLVPSSLFDWLRAVSRTLTMLCPWQDWEAVWFVLTGACPTVRAIQVGLEERRLPEYGRCVVNLSVEPWVSGRTLNRIYRQVQREILGQDNRPIAVKNLAVFAFVVERAARESRIRSWAQLATEWNRHAKPEWRYGDSRNFRRDYYRVGQAVVVPKHHRIRATANEEASK